MILPRQAGAPAREMRGTLFVEDARVIAVREYPGRQFVLRLYAPQCAGGATAGSFVHVRCDRAIPMRRPLSIMRADADDGWIELLFKVVGDGLRALGERRPGDEVSVIGPIGYGFRPSVERPNALLLGGGVGIPPMIFLAETLHRDVHAWSPLVLMGSELPFPFTRRSSSIACPWLPAAVDSAMPLLDAWGIPSRLASLSDFDGCFRGYVTELAAQWLDGLSTRELGRTELFACGPMPMLKAVAELARERGLPCQVALEEFMACAVGGCAGCTVAIRDETGTAMKRVCVDGPVFNAEQVFPAGH